MLAIFANDDKIIRDLAVTKVLILRKVNQSKTETATSFSSARKFVMPIISEKADAYHKLVNLMGCDQLQLFAAFPIMT